MTFWLKSWVDVSFLTHPPQNFTFNFAQGGLLRDRSCDLLVAWHGSRRFTGVEHALETTSVGFERSTRLRGFASGMHVV